MPGWSALLPLGAIALGIGLFVAGLLAGLGTRGGPPSTARSTIAAAPRPTAPAPAPGHGAAADEGFPITWVGDILIGERAQESIDRFGHAWPFERVRFLLAGSYAIGNLEAPITERSEDHFPWAPYDYNVQPPAARALAEVGFKAVGLSNNHALDRGPEGLGDTLHYLREAGVTPFGAGMDAEEAGAPLLVPTRHGTVAVLGFGDAWKQGAAAASGQFGTLSHVDANVVHYAERARAAGARWVVAFVHWGDNYKPVISDQRRAAERFAQAGYDLVVGHHPHIAQPVELVQGMPVLYSIGNFVFGTGGRFTPEAPGYGLVARTTFEQGGLGSIQLTCILTDNDVVKFQPRPCPESQARQVMQGLGPHVRWWAGKGLIEW